MTIDALITKLKSERDRLDTAIEVLEESLKSRSDNKKRRDIIAKLKGNKKKKDYKGKHWTQLPKNKAKVAKLAKARAALAKKKGQ